MLRPALIALAGVVLWAAPVLAEAPQAALARLRQLGVPVALPADVPPGFALTQVLKPKVWGGPAFAGGYVALYQGPSGEGFAIESAGVDMGDGAGAWNARPQAVVRSDWFAQDVELYWRGPRQNMPPSWVSGWIEGPGQYYRLIGPGHVRNDHGVAWAVSREVSQLWAEKILASIRIPGVPARRRGSPSAMPTPFVSDFEQDNQWRDLRR